MQEIAGAAKAQKEDDRQYPLKDFLRHVDTTELRVCNFIAYQDVASHPLRGGEHKNLYECFLTKRGG